MSAIKITVYTGPYLTTVVKVDGKIAYETITTPQHEANNIQKLIDLIFIDNVEVVEIKNG